MRSELTNSFSEQQTSCTAGLYWNFNYAPIQL